MFSHGSVIVLSGEQSPEEVKNESGQLQSNVEENKEALEPRHSKEKLETGENSSSKTTGEKYSPKVSDRF